MSLIILENQSNVWIFFLPPEEILQHQPGVLWIKSDTPHRSHKTAPSFSSPPSQSYPSDPRAVNWGTMIPSLDLNILPEPLMELKRNILLTSYKRK